MPDLKIIRFSGSDSEKLKITFSIRKQVFVVEQNVDPEIELDAFEKESTHYLVYHNDTPVATARWRITKSGIKLERFAVLKHYRNQHIGQQILSEVMKDVIPSGKQIYLHTKYGFVKKGEVFYEAEIPHYLMIFQR